VKMFSKTQLTGEDGRALATGSKTVAAQLAVGEELLINYDQQWDYMWWSPDLWYIPIQGRDRASVIRKLAGPVAP
jgi:hypothetical protein